MGPQDGFRLEKIGDLQGDERRDEPSGGAKVGSSSQDVLPSRLAIWLHLFAARSTGQQSVVGINPRCRCVFAQIAVQIGFRFHLLLVGSVAAGQSGTKYHDASNRFEPVSGRRWSRAASRSRSPVGPEPSGPLSLAFQIRTVSGSPGPIPAAHEKRFPEQ